MPTPKGYRSDEKLDNSRADHTTISNAGHKKYALDVSDKSTVFEAGTDEAEAGSTTQVINATGHSVQQYDKIRFTSGTNDEIIVDVEEIIDADSFRISQVLDAAPIATDTFSILRHVPFILTSSGGFSTVNTFILDGSNQAVTEDTVTPANNRPLPVKLTGFDGDVNIDSSNLNLAVQLAHDGAAPDSVQIGDGTEILAINASSEAQVADDTARTSLDNIDNKLVDGTDIGDVTVNNTLANPVISQITDGTETVSVNASSELQVRDDDANALLTTIDADTSNLDVALSTVATEATLSTLNGKLVDGTDIGDVTVNNTAGNPVPISDAGGSVTVDDGGVPLTISATDLDIRDLSASQDNVAISDGSNTAAVNVSSELQVRDDDANTTLSSMDSSLSTIDTSTQTIAGWDTNSGAVGATTLRTHLTDESLAALETINVEIDHTNDSVRLGDGTTLTNVSVNNELQVRDDDANTSLDNIETDMGTVAGAVSGTEMQVDIVAELPAGTQTIGSVDLNRLDVVDVFDTPVLDASSSNIPGSAGSPLEVVASLAADVQKVHLQDTTGFYIGLYTGAAASEVLKMIINPGSDSIVECALASGTRISLRRLDSTTAIDVGQIAINFLG
jgi:hypothetical protein